MKIAGFRLGGALHLGLVEDGEVINLQAIDPRIPSDLGVWLGANDGDLAPLALLASKAPAAARHPIDSISFALPVARPGKVICLGLNYVDHIAEGPYAAQRADHPSIFMRVGTSLVPHGSALLKPAVSDKLDYEAELAVIIGKRAKHLTPANALSCVAGYSCFNESADIGARLPEVTTPHPVLLPASSPRRACWEKDRVRGCDLLQFTDSRCKG
jgi:acylpyruvate hydrolase